MSQLWLKDYGLLLVGVKVMKVKVSHEVKFNHRYATFGWVGLINFGITNKNFVRTHIELNNKEFLLSENFRIHV